MSRMGRLFKQFRSPTGSQITISPLIRVNFLNSPGFGFPAFVKGISDFLERPDIISPFEHFLGIHTLRLDFGGLETLHSQSVSSFSLKRVLFLVSSLFLVLISLSPRTGLGKLSLVFPMHTPRKGELVLRLYPNHTISLFFLGLLRLPGSFDN